MEVKNCPVSASAWPWRRRVPRDPNRGRSSEARVSSDYERLFGSPDSLRATRRRFAGCRWLATRAGGRFGRGFWQSPRGGGFRRSREGRKTGYDRFRDRMSDRVYSADTGPNGNTPRPFGGSIGFRGLTGGEGQSFVCCPKDFRQREPQRRRGEQGCLRLCRRFRPLVRPDSARSESSRIQQSRSRYCTRPSYRTC